MRLFQIQITLTTFAIILGSDVPHVLTRVSFQLARICVVAPIITTHRLATNAVSITVASLRADTAVRQGVDRRNTLGGVVAFDIGARIAHIWRVNITSLNIAYKTIGGQ